MAAYCWRVLGTSETIDKKNKKYEYGLKGLAKILGCSRSTASKIKSSGILDEAICQNGKLIIIDKEKALELLKKSKE